jgi:hypothetical protein
MNDTVLITQKTNEILPEHVLNCTHSGQILIDYPATKSLQEKFIEKANSNSEQREKFNISSLDSNRIKIKELLSITENKEPIRVKTIQKNTENPLYKEEIVILKQKNEPKFPFDY